MSFALRRSARRATALLLGVLATVAHANLPTVPSAPAPLPAAGVGAGGLLQAVFGMACVLGLILLCAWMARRFGLQRFGGGHVVKVVSSTSVGQRERVVVVEVADQWLVLGVTPHNISTLHSLPAQASAQLPLQAATPAHAAQPLAQATQAFSQLLRHSLGMKARATTRS